MEKAMSDEIQTRWHEKYFHSERIDMLTDGIYAIVLTLLVLDLRIPVLKDEHSIAELWTETKKIFPHLWSFLITFLWIANSWHSSQSYNRLIVKSDAMVIWLQLFMLMLICLIPFPTALMGEYPDNPLGVIYFGVLVSISSFLVVAITQYTFRKKYISEHVDMEDLRRKINMIPKFLPLYFVPMAVAFYSPTLAQIIYFSLGITWIFQTGSWKLKSPSESF